MNRTALIALAVALVTPFAAFADQAYFGIPDVTCQTPDEWNVHDYGAPATGNLVFNPQDGTLDGCPGVRSTWLDPAGNECAILGSEPETTRAYRALCVDDRPYDFDGDSEYANGGAWLVSRSGDGLACWGSRATTPRAPRST